MINRLHKEGFQREDGKYYWLYNKTKKKHIWLTKEQLERRKATRSAYRKACIEEYNKRQAKKAPEDRNYFGKYSFAKNKYFISVSSSGKEVWYVKEKFLKFKMQCQKNKRNFVERLKQFDGKHVKIGDVCPDNPSLFCIFKIGNKPYYGTAKKLKQWREARAMSYRKRNIKNRKHRREKLRMLEKRLRRGDVHPENNMIFWEYNCKGKEIWLPSDEFHVKRQTETLKRRKNRLICKQKRLVANDQSEIHSEIHETSEVVRRG